MSPLRGGITFTKLMGLVVNPGMSLHSLLIIRNVIVKQSGIFSSAWLAHLKAELS